MNRYEPYERFRTLHDARTGFVMPSAWDGVSALLIKKAGFPAIGTSPTAFAFSLGVPSGVGAVSRSEEIDNAVTIGTLTGLPVNGDFEDGFGLTCDDCISTVEAAIEAGLAGIELDDSTANPFDPTHHFDAAVRRMRSAAEAAGGRILLTAAARNVLHRDLDFDDVVRRLVAFAEVGADVLAAPVTSDLDMLRKIVHVVAPKPVSIVAHSYDPIPLSDLFSTGARRVSLGAALYCHAMAKVEEACGVLARGDLIAATSGIWPSQIGAMIRDATLDHLPES